MGDCRELSARNRAISLSDKPTGTGASDCESGIGASRLGDCRVLKPSARKRAISLSDKPTGTGVSGRGSGVGGVTDGRWTISASGPLATNGCSAKILESCAAPEICGSKGVTISSGPASLKSENTDLGLARLRRCRTKMVTPITAKTAATPPITTPTIVAKFPFRFPCDDDDGKFVSTGRALAFIVWTGTLTKSSQERKKEAFVCTNLRANGAYIAPSAGLITITPYSVGILDIVSQLTHLPTP